MNAKLKFSILLVFLLAAVFPARADFTGPPMEAIVTLWILGLVGGFFACALLALIVKRIIEEFTKRKRRHIWFQTIFMYLFLALFLYLEDSEHILSDFTDETRMNLYWILFFSSLTLGCVIGYRITPKKKEMDEKTPKKKEMDEKTRIDSFE
jgi:amino acid transporter